MTSFKFTKYNIGRAFIYLILLFFAFIYLAPLYVMFTTSLKDIEDLKILYPDIKYKGYVTDPINKTEIRGRFLLKFQVIKPEIL